MPVVKLWNLAYCRAVRKCTGDRWIKGGMHGFRGSVPRTPGPFPDPFHALDQPFRSLRTTFGEFPHFHSGGLVGVPVLGLGLGPLRLGL